MAEKAAEQQSQQVEWPSFAVGSVLILVLTLLVYFPSLRGEFLWDDDVMLTRNQHIQAPAASEGLRAIWFSTNQPDYLPLTSTSFWIEWRFWGMNPSGYRAVNLFLHTLNAILLWRLLRQLKVPGAFLAGMIFAAHPVCVASVAWIAERKNTLSMFFFLLSILFFLRAEPNSRITHHTSRWYWLALGSFLLALLSKGSVVMLPMVLLLVIWWRRGDVSPPQAEDETSSIPLKERQISREDLFRIAPFFALSTIFSIVTIWFQFQRSMGGQTMVNQLGLFEKAIAAIWAVGFYFSKAIWPVSLAMVYPQWELKGGLVFYCIPALVLIIGLILTWRFWRSQVRHFLLALGYFIFMLAPILGFVGMYFHTYARVADHWQYLALLGIIAGVTAGIQYLASGFQRLEQRALFVFTRWILPAGIVAAFSILTWQRAMVFSRAETLWNDTLSKNPKCWAAFAHLGNISAERGKHGAAVQHFSHALALKPDYAEVHFNLANTLASMGDLEKAALHFNEALRFKTRYPEAHYNFGLLLERQGKFDDALSHYFEAIRLNPAHTGAHNNAGNLLAEAGRDAEAAEYYTKALRLNPTMPAGYNNLANVLQRMGKTEESVPYYLRAIELQPDYADAHRNLSIALKALGKEEEASRHWNEALRLSPAQ